MNSYLTVRKLLGHPNTCKLLNGYHPLIEKKNMMVLTSEWSKNKPPPPLKAPKPAPIASRSNFNVKKAAKILEQGQRQSTIHKTIHPGLHNPKDSTGCH
ncbi:hypothetical protein O181_132377 [Austropuccinia psidii MF-1]|uniref:Uncharacterized protein n=1 Tax=Austropuccinia psidii MF-1 TaxID=1389203 RepID=A0A9Q3L4V9_9BASI|nr:hypothetical protein [Austropuccinia psidii MF-1]